jgi:hypothetical protein
MIHSSEGIKFANKSMKSFGSHDVHFMNIVNHFLGVCYGLFLYVVHFKFAYIDITR